MNREHELDQQLDALNAERAPRATDAEMAELLAVARTVRGLRAEPAAAPAVPKAPAQKRRGWRRWLALPAVGAAALFVAVFLAAQWRPASAMAAMEEALTQLHSLHGVLQGRMEEADGRLKDMTKREIWMDGRKFFIVEGNNSVLSDGEHRWHVQSETKRVVETAVVLDDSFWEWDLREVARVALRQPHNTVGSDLVTGRKTTVVAVAPPGRHPYRIWIDDETHLVIQWESFDHLDRRWISTYTTFEVNPQVSPDRFVLRPPAGYEMVPAKERRVASVAEAQQVAGFAPVIPKDPPRYIVAGPGTISLDYGDTLIRELPKQHDFIGHPLDDDITYGQAAGGRLMKYPGDTIEWVQQGVAIYVQGERMEELGRQLSPDLTLPDAAQDLVGAAQVKISVDRAAAEHEQALFDRGQAWRRGYPGSMVVYFIHNVPADGDLPRDVPQVVDYLKVVAKTDAQAVYESAIGPYKRIYLQRLVRQDQTGAWWIVGYDPR